MSLGSQSSPERNLKRTESTSSLNQQERGIHWGDGTCSWTNPLQRSMDEDILSTSPPQSDSSDDAGDQNDSCDVGVESKQSPPIPEDATAPGINDIFTGCLDTIRRTSGVWRVSSQTSARAKTAHRSAHERRRGNNRSGNRQVHNRTRNASSNKGSLNNGFQPPPPPGAAPNRQARVRERWRGRLR